MKFLFPESLSQLDPQRSSLDAPAATLILILLTKFRVDANITFKVYKNPVRAAGCCLQAIFF